MLGHRTRQFGKIKVESAQLVAVVFQIVHVEYHRLFGDRIVEHDRRIVGDHRIRSQIKLGDIRIGGGIDDVWLFDLLADGLADQIVQAQQ